MNKVVFTLAIMVMLWSILGVAEAITLFSEDFNGYTVVPNSGLPLQSEGANEFWYGGRFESPDGGTIDEDLRVQEYSGMHPSPVARFEDDAGVLFNISTVGYQNVQLSFDWRTGSTTNGDEFVAGYFTGTLPGSGSYRDFVSLLGGHDNAVNWWNTNWTEIVRGRKGWWPSISSQLPGGESSVWVAFWLDNGEGDYGAIDNILVTADSSGSHTPEPATMCLMGFGILGLLGFSIRQRRKK